MALRQQWPQNQRYKKPKDAPPSPCGYVGVIVAIYYDDFKPKNDAIGIFKNIESGHNYHYSVDDFYAHRLELGEKYYLSIGMDKDLNEIIVNLTEVREHDNPTLLDDILK